MKLFLSRLEQEEIIVFLVPNRRNRMAIAHLPSLGCATDSCCDCFHHTFNHWSCSPSFTAFFCQNNN